MKKAIKNTLIKRIVFWISLLIDLTAVPILIYIFIFNGKIYPNINVAGISLSKMTVHMASQVLSDKVEAPEKIKLTYQDQSFELITKDLSLTYDFPASAERAYKYTRTGNIFLDIGTRLGLLINPKNIGLATTYDRDKLGKFISVVSAQISVEPILPSAKITNGKAVITNGTNGTIINNELLTAQIGNAFSEARASEIKIETREVDAKLTEIELKEFQKRLDTFVGKAVEIKFGADASVFDTFKYKDQDIILLLNPRGGFNDDALVKLVSGLSDKVDRDPQNPKFSFDGNRVSEFLPAKDGIKVDRLKLKVLLEGAIDELSVSDTKSIAVEAPVALSPPEATTDKVNNLGIKELIGRGTSTYFHSIPGRIHNVSLATSRINGTLVKPGDTFSFNDTLGDVSQFTGYQQAYVISEGKTILGDGGGVCQVSTTLFRALLNAGLPITDRTAHAYRVGYYEQNSPPGLDATVYGPTPDLKFKNDTPGYILITATANPKNLSLVFELYGTSDGRKAVVSKPVIANVTPALPTVYQDDPTLPLSKTKQIDYAAAGARVSFNYSVERNGENIYKKTFISNYRPWAAVYLRGTGPN